MNSRVRSSLSLLARLLVTLLTLGFLLRTIPLDKVGAALSHANWSWVALTLLLSEYSMWTQASRWHRLIVEPPERKPPVRQVFRYTAIGYLFNLVLPTGFGGDVVKSIGLGREFQVMGSSVAAMAMARLLGSIALLFFFWLALPWLGGAHLGHAWIWGMALGMAAFCLVLFLALSADRVPWIQRLASRNRHLEAIRTNLV
ncbi:MAG TPA: lysylphosphatidylglycerol synthase transmembrane domain-containing protein, partial [Fibrobacteraceae bacterium]|nr:lysylphosphatidylglycerol synthase transmembrane domain-containing protein [Fibrobacteraceae bacterium]